MTRRNRIRCEAYQTADELQARLHVLYGKRRRIKEYNATGDWTVLDSKQCAILVTWFHKKLDDHFPFAYTSTLQSTIELLEGRLAWVERKEQAVA